jgi:hypothetical protein
LAAPFFAVFREAFTGAFFAAFLSADIKGKRLWIKVSDRDLYPVQRRVAAWLARCESQQLGLLWEMESAESCGAYDSMERAISSMGYRSGNTTGYPPDEIPPDTKGADTE